MTAEATEDLPAMPAKGCDEPIGGRPEGDAPPSLMPSSSRPIIAAARERPHRRRGLLFQH